MEYGDSASKGTRRHSRKVSVTALALDRPLHGDAGAYEVAIPAWAGEPLPISTTGTFRTGHLRVGGGTEGPVQRVLDRRGPSPRGRGNPTEAALPAPCRGAIPAWAGEPGDLHEVFEPERGHPRVGGGTTRRRRRRGMRDGPSPRGRGNQTSAPMARAGRRAIPAWAGEPPMRSRRRPCGGGHPRVGGGTIRGHPRVGGGTVKTSPPQLQDDGPSPRGRGNRHEGGAHHLALGAIPAWAGEPRAARSTRTARRGHPRVGGGTRANRCPPITIVGPSPRGRGNRAPGGERAPVDRAIPAWAGEPRHGGVGEACATGHPRVGGGTGRRTSPEQIAAGPSPRGRGNPCERGADQGAGGAIPAWAGEPRHRIRPVGDFGGHPRVGGGTCPCG